MTPDELRELLSRLVGAVGEKDGDGKLTLKTVIGGLQTHAHTVYQAVFNAGHEARGKEAEKERASLDKRVKELEGQIVTLTAEKEQLSKGDHAQRIRDLETQITTIQGEKQGLETRIKEVQVEAKRDGAMMLVRAGLAGVVDGDYAEVLTSKDDVRKRIRVNDDLTVDFLQPNGVPFAPAEGKAGHDLLVGELVESTKRDKPHFVLSAADSGSDTGRGNRGQHSQGGDRAFYDGIRKSAQDANPPGPRTGNLGAQRLGIAPAPPAPAPA